MNEIEDMVPGEEVMEGQDQEEVKTPVNEIDDVPAIPVFPDVQEPAESDSVHSSHSAEGMNQY